MILYHGSSTAGIDKLLPFTSNDQKPYVYLTHSEVLAAIYSHNPLTRPNGYFTYWWGKDGKLYYDEYFENQTKEIYSGQKGFVYECAGDYPRMDKMPWVYLSEEPVQVVKCTEIPDIYEKLLCYEREGLLTINRWHEASEKQREIWVNVVRRSLEKKDLSTPLAQEYYYFVKKHFNEI